ncbi:MAG TPA: hypothetical protein P5089_01710 [Candidatus Portnoybacteria bacterium]|nr:hypothetical protein [Candidatus Portnoybacteria bacterium]
MNNFYLKLFVIMLVVISITAFLVYYFFFKSDQSMGPEQSLGQDGQQGCVLKVQQPDCQASKEAKLSFSWENCAEEQKSFKIEVSRAAYFNNSFSDVVFSTDKIESAETRYEIKSESLVAGEKYYAGVTVWDALGQAAGWWGWGNSNFQISPLCD